jgi:predicted DNA-binding transcriptional regulator YafY
VAFGPEAALYVRERTWSQDQAVEDQADGGLTLAFTATSRPEVLSWVLSFGHQARLLEPEDLADQVQRELSETLKAYE